MDGCRYKYRDCHHIGSLKILGLQANVESRPSRVTTRTDDELEAILTGDKVDDSDPASANEAKEAGWLATIFEI